MIVNNKLERIWKEWSWPNVRYYPSISHLLEISMDNDDGNLYFGHQIKKKWKKKKESVILYLQMKRKHKWIFLDEKLENTTQKNEVIDKDYGIIKFPATGDIYHNHILK
jgi:Holliday junction resolvase